MLVLDFPGGGPGHAKAATKLDAGNTLLVLRQVTWRGLAQVMERDATKQLSGRIELDDAYLGRECTGGKRGRGAPGQDTVRRRRRDRARGQAGAPEAAPGLQILQPLAFDLRQAEARSDVQGGQRWTDLFRCLRARWLCASGRQNRLRRCRSHVHPYVGQYRIEQYQSCRRWNIQDHV
jgi:hypothetical protein